MFHANPKAINKLRLAQFLKVDSPPKNELIELNNRLYNFSNIFKKHSVNIPKIAPNEDISILVNAFKESYGLRPYERGLAALISILEHDIATHQDLAQQYYMPPEDIDTISIFSPVPVTPTVEKMIGPNNSKVFSQPLLRADSIIKDLENIERLAGKSQEKAKVWAQTLIDELQATTGFPSEIKHPNSSKEQLLVDINRLIVALGGTPYAPPAINNQQDASIGPDIEPLPELPDLSDFENIDALYQPEEFPDFAELKDLEKNLSELDFNSFNLDNLPNLNDPNALKKMEALLDKDLLAELHGKTDDDMFEQEPDDKSE